MKELHTICRQGGGEKFVSDNSISKHIKASKAHEVSMFFGMTYPLPTLKIRACKPLFAIGYFLQKSGCELTTKNFHANFWTVNK